MTPITESLTDLLNNDEPLLDQAKRLFPDFPKAQKVWAQLGTSGAGGILETVGAIGLQKEHDEYMQQYGAFGAKGKNEAAAELLAQFIKFCQQQILYNYHKFA